MVRYWPRWTRTALLRAQMDARTRDLECL